MNRGRSLLLAGALLAFGGFGASAAPQTIKTDALEVVVDDGWLTQWTNKRTGETISFGKPALDRANRDDRHYIPGPWWVDWQCPQDLTATGTTCAMNVKADGADAIEIVQSARREGGDVHAVQWGLRLPYDQIQALHWPRGLAPARLSGNGYPEGMVRPSYLFANRPAMLSGAEGIRAHYYVIQARKGGLLITMDNADLKHHMALEFKKPSDGELIISNRSIMPPPWKDQYTGARWVIRQYDGPVSVAAQICQESLAKTWNLLPLEQRPTAWVKDLSFVFVNGPLRGPAAFAGKRIPESDFTDPENWRRSMTETNAWLERLSKVVDPSKVMLYVTDWRVDGMDLMFPTTDVDPYFALMVGRARSMGYHVMLHTHNHLVHEPTSFYQRYILHPAKLKGQDPARDLLWGVGYCALRHEAMIQRDKLFGSSWDERKGLPRKMTGYHMNPAYGGWRYLQVASILTALRATGADAVHIDVPNVWIDLRSELYGMNQMEGLREFYKLLRETLDANGMRHVAIATELTPFEGNMRYVDMAQNSRDTSARSRAEEIQKGGTLAGEELIALQQGAELDKLMAARTKEATAQAAKGTFSPEAARKILAKAKDLGEPALDSMVIAPYIQSYPHLGAFPGNGMGRAMAIWYSLTHDVMPHTTGEPPFTPGSLDDLEVGKYALARFWAAEAPRLMLPRDWQPGDVARYRLKDGRVVRVTRADASVLRLAFADGAVLAELDLIDGWRNDAALRKYAPEELRAKPTPKP